jgi:hypothetical protein
LGSQLGATRKGFFEALAMKWWKTCSLAAGFWVLLLAVLTTQALAEGETFTELSTTLMRNL